MGQLGMVARPLGEPLDARQDDLIGPLIIFWHCRFDLRRTFDLWANFVTYVAFVLRLLLVWLNSQGNNKEGNPMIKAILFLTVCGFFFWPAWGLAMILLLSYTMSNAPLDQEYSLPEALQSHQTILVIVALTVAGFFAWQAWIMALLLVMHYSLRTESMVTESAGREAMASKYGRHQQDDLIKAMAALPK